MGNRERNPTVQSPAGLEEIQTEIRAEGINNVVYDYLNGMTLGYGLRAAYIGNVFKDYTGQVVGIGSDDVYEMTTAGEHGDMRRYTQFYSFGNLQVNPDPIRNLYHSSVEEYRVDVPTESSGSSILPSADVSASVALPLDTYDQSLVDAFRALTNPRNDETLPTLVGGTPYTDDDHDGMEDAWERTRFGDLGQDGTGDDYGDGYTDLEEFLNSLY
ncbi:MAG: hypothetical protein ACI9KE_000698 [Polyangiales bacterium]